MTILPCLARIRCRLPLLLAMAGGFLLAGVVNPARAEKEAIPFTAIPFSKVAPIFEKHCHSCHGKDVEKPKGDLRLDKLDPDFLHGKDEAKWREVLDRLNFGDMPPEDEPAMAAEDREILVAWLVQERRRAALARNPAAHFRRLTRREYELSMQELLGVAIPFAGRLPEDGRSPEGFRNNGELLRMSPLQYEMYLSIAEEGLAEAIVNGDPPEVHRYRIARKSDKPAELDVTALPKPEDRPGESFKYFKQEGKDKAFRIWNLNPPSKEKGKESPADGSLLPSVIGRHSEAAVKVPQHSFSIAFHRAFRKGEMLIRVRAARVEDKKEQPPEGEAKEGDQAAKAKEAKPDRAARIPMLSVALGCTNMHGAELTLVGAPLRVEDTEYRTYEFRVRMESMPLPNIDPPSDRNASVLSAWNSARIIKGESDPPRLAIEWIEVETPYIEIWPPVSHTAILFPNDKNLPEPDYAREVVRRFATRAYRRPLAPPELDRLLQYWTAAREGADSIEASLRETLSVVLASPQFLSLTPGKTGPGAGKRLDDHELASRLAYFLWSSPPDATLMELADKSQLHEPAVLARETRRMLADPKAWRFFEQFAEQWLELDRLQRVTVSRSKYPEFNDDLAASMRLETMHFLAELARSDESIFQILDSDFTCVNETLAAHYGIAGVIGPQFRRVPLEASQHRGGVLTHAAILTGLSDGNDGHPIKRGMWVLKNLLDDLPPPPPPNVPELKASEVKAKGLSITQALAMHRSSNACNGCHKKIDPWGIAFEEYDAVGNWQRDGLGAEIRRRRTGQKVESAAELPGGTKIAGLKDLQTELIRSRGDDFRRTVLRKVLSYSLGRALTLQDLETADALAPVLKERGDRMGALIELVVASEAFQSK